MVFSLTTDQQKLADLNLLCREYSSSFIQFSTEFIYYYIYIIIWFQYNKGASLSSLCIICSLGQLKNFFEKCIMAFYLSLGKYHILLFCAPT